MSPSEKIVNIENLTFQYDDVDEPTLNNISLQINRGEMVLLCGPTGCGKSTLALCLNGLIPFTSGGKITGKIDVCGLNPTETPTPKMATKVGLVFQDPEGQLCTLFLEDEIAFGPENLKVARTELSKRVSELLSLISLKHMREESVFELSGGQKQKVNIVSVLAMQPELLVFDMPTANLDPVGSEEVFQVIRRLVTENDITCIVIENRLDDLAPLADRVVVMRQNGTIAYDGTPGDVFAHGLEILNELGVEIPQIVELELKLRETKLLGANHRIPLTSREMVQRMETHLNLSYMRSVQASDLQIPESRITDHTVGEDSLATPVDKSVVKVEDLHFSYHKGVEILKGLSFQVKKGDLLAIVGNNGSGKTTMAKLLVGLLKPSSGKLKVCGLDVSQASISEIATKAAYVFQYPDHQFVAQGMAVRDEIAFNMQMAGFPLDVIEQRVEFLLQSFSLKEKEASSPFTLSGGEMRTLSVACMLSISPELLILDEPTYGQDNRRIGALMKRLAELREERTSVIMITHDMRLVAEYATAVALFNNGRIIFNGQPQELFNQSDLLKIAALKEPPICSVASGLSDRGYLFCKNLITISDFIDVLA